MRLTPGRAKPKKTPTTPARGMVTPAVALAGIPLPAGLDGADVVLGIAHTYTMKNTVEKKYISEDAT